MDNSENKSWKGVHISQLQTSLNRHQVPKLIPSDEHIILFKLPVKSYCSPECYPPISDKKDFWDNNHVKLPCSDKNITKEQINRWEVMKNAFSTHISTSQELEAAILSYNKRYADQWNFSSLHLFFDNIDEVESDYFFGELLPKIVKLALSLPLLITSGIPLLKHGQKRSVSLSQLQISCLLANAFLCSFPHRNWAGKNSEYFDYPDINFNRLYQCEDSSRIDSVLEKLKCIINYFRRVTLSVPTGVVTYSRTIVPSNLYPEWSKSNSKFPKLHVSSSGTIEDDGFGLFQVDFANKFVGGGVIGTGCVQEEIRFVVCPELILSRLFTQCLSDNEALVVTGCERFNKYNGYGWSFEWDGDYVDGTPSDEYSRKYCTVIALDAVCYKRNPNEQYSLENIYRDLNKAYVGFCWGSRRKKEELCAVATGNWGCGVFGGDPQLKSLLQLMASAEVGRDLAYFTFGDTELRDSMALIHQFLTDNNVTIGKIWKLLHVYNARKLYLSTKLYDYVRNNAIVDDIEEAENPANKDEGSKLYKLFSSSKAMKKRSLCYRTKTFEQQKENGDTSLVLQNSQEEKMMGAEFESLADIYAQGTPNRKEQRLKENNPETSSFNMLDTMKMKFRSRYSHANRKSKFEETKIDQVSSEIVSDSFEHLVISSANTTVDGNSELIKDDDFEKTSKLNNNATNRVSEEKENENEADIEQTSMTDSSIASNRQSGNKIDNECVAKEQIKCLTPSKLLIPHRNKFSQKRKISDYFNPVSKKPNCES